ncbi:MAG: hypothetical protein K0R97_1718 [Oerskovia sp.]|nr:hypothetical protein [Oerskovia sp.]
MIRLSTTTVMAGERGPDDSYGHEDGQGNLVTGWTSSRISARRDPAVVRIAVVASRSSTFLCALPRSLLLVSGRPVRDDPVGLVVTASEVQVAGDYVVGDLVERL